MGVALFLWGLATVGYSPTVERLGDPDYATREAADDELRAAGPWAWPAIISGLSHQSAEVYARCLTLSARCRSIEADAAAWWLLIGPEPDWYSVWCGERAGRLVRLTRAAGLAPHDDESEGGPVDGWCWWDDPVSFEWVMSGMRRTLAFRDR